MDLPIPTWVDFGKIGGIAFLVLAVTQYCKGWIPDKFIKPFAIAVGLLFAALCECLTKTPVYWATVLLNGIMAAVMADLGYSFFSKKGGVAFLLPSKPKPTEAPPDKPNEGPGGP